MIVPENSVHYLEFVTREPDKLRYALEKSHGWTFAQVADLAGSWVAEMPGGGRCGIRAPMHEQEKPIVRSYVRVADLDRAVEIARANGAELLLSPMKVGAQGRIAIYAIAGIEQGLWELGSELGSEL